MWDLIRSFEERILICGLKGADTWYCGGGRTRKNTPFTLLRLERDSQHRDVSGAVAQKGPAYLVHCAFKAKEEKKQHVQSGGRKIRAAAFFAATGTSGALTLEEISA